MFYTILIFSSHLRIVINDDYTIEGLVFPFELLLYQILQQKQTSHCQNHLSYAGENLRI